MTEIHADRDAVHPIRHDISLLTDDDLFLFNQGSHFRLWDKLGAHSLVVDGQPGTIFAVWAPNAEAVSVIGDFNGWDTHTHPLHSRASSGIWEGWLGGVASGVVYKYHIASRVHGARLEKADPFAFAAEVAPKSASVIWDLAYDWNDTNWMGT
ncbi:MAG: 1,4-alpha-glucan branching enzyme, partial [Acidobacteria bacterium]|nr:1,4-alpha-glucan branching enzyme [Acidobacteriota bacterium]